ncbi:MAG: hypothetical protein WC941_04770 [Candidatus Bathyarchaeia archaeon]
MPRISLAEELYREAEDCGDDDGRWIIVYDFEGRPNPRFWMNLHRLSRLCAGSRLTQFSVYVTGSRRVARVAVHSPGTTARLSRYSGGSRPAHEKKIVDTIFRGFRITLIFGRRSSFLY